MSTEKRIGVIAIVIDEPKAVQEKVNHLISENGDLIVGRMGIPYRERNVAVISLVVDGTENEINTLTGKLGSIPGVNARTVMAKKF
jgi:putative iron-only hydrogenase system regulator